MLSVTPVTGAPVVFVNVTTVSWVEPGANVCRPGGPGAAAAATATVPLRPLPDESSTLSPLRLVELVARDVAGARSGLQRRQLRGAERAVVDLEVVDRAR